MSSENPESTDLDLNSLQQEVPTLENKIESTSVQSEAQGSAGDIGAKDTEESVKSDPVKTTGTAHEPSETAEKGGEEVQTEPVKGDVESSEKPAEEGDKKGESGKSAEKKVSKVEIRLQATGDAPIMKKRNYMVEESKKISEIISFVRKYLKLETSENLFLYVNQAFAPSPDQTILNLNECFGSDGKLVLYYSRNQAWG
ncbi:autophagy protein 12-like [Eurytemora carolleeae]|uniref:autophagy protein 12-like n=1 Tax=Eurytemora carolleeae TaxID=1294199 RepID=UPI000C7886FC|nr:autophagy protein 12-like [Eurytemora carolleeae]|eukprot:XP_023338354.1 autophagy protein 12-like [Eurytemora affinis]